MAYLTPTDPPAGATRRLVPWFRRRRSRRVVGSAGILCLLLLPSCARKPDPPPPQPAARPPQLLRNSPAAAGLPVYPGAHGFEEVPAARFPPRGRDGTPFAPWGWDIDRAFQFRVPKATPGQVADFYQRGLVKAGWTVEKRADDRVPPPNHEGAQLDRVRMVALRERERLEAALTLTAFRARDRSETVVHLMRYKPQRAAGE